MQRLAGVLLEMQPLDTDPHGLTVRQIDDHLAFSDERRFVLADLITLREIGIKVVLAVEHRFQVDPRREPEASALNCGKSITGRAFIPTPGQWGLSLSKSWRF